MSAVFEFDDLPSHKPEIPEEEDDTAKARDLPLDEKLYEVPLDESFISSSLTTTNLSISQRKVTLDDFEILKLLGRGAYGKVMMCRHKESNQLYAMKVLKKASLFLHAKNAEHTKAERQILEEVRHPW
ncbi:hypothetical protein G6F46_013236 [Rhizopus delemar]|uniref:non-specific serine/threonine protein kinase n=1 Tax=Rhizopus oryzae TaxID=64495 RepID=A0A9P6XTA9_RHIOR|nr:hypothetical protein G6F55_013137 [Rhizopus delemar]KAG1531725.1 hypothetical protein G6F51_013405 [Rhizopus arrhizus]KAG1486744.1 hypothetical protein G6F54_013121 [Rhizopus delemar]KAG1491031.1 hypothetical protein G6F53_013161 [Rhizopus delemar]KAG1496472.1 hypothetical protein G6F52_012933 [Rhizopus delemar]